VEVQAGCIAARATLAKADCAVELFRDARVENQLGSFRDPKNRLAHRDRGRRADLCLKRSGCGCFGAATSRYGTEAYKVVRNSEVGRRINFDATFAALIRAGKLLFRLIGQVFC
jgi:hypothetical protein